MKQEAATFEKALKSGNAEAAARANVSFYAALTELSVNRALREASEAAQHLVRLGSKELPPGVDSDALLQAHSTLLTALSEGDAGSADEALQRARTILTR